MPERTWDNRLSARGAKLTTYTPQPNESFWRLTAARWLDVEQSAGKHAIFVEVLDEAGKRVIGEPVRFFWDGGQQVKETEAKPNDAWAVDFPMFNAGFPYSIRMEHGVGDSISGMGLGTIEEPWVGYHTSYMLTFQRVAGGAAGAMGEPPSAPDAADHEIVLTGHSVVRVVTNGFELMLTIVSDKADL